MYQEIVGLPPRSQAQRIVDELARRERVGEERKTLTDDLSAYLREAWKIVEPSTPYMHNWHIDAISEHLKAVTIGQIRNLCILIPPRHAKSSIVSVMWPTWLWTFQPQHRFLFASYALQLSIRDALRSRRVIQSPWYQERWGNVFHLSGDQGAKMRYENDRSGYRIATAVGGSATGEGGNTVVCDDPHNLKEIHSDVIREGVLDWWDHVMSTRLNNPKTDSRIIIMQRGHEADLAGHVMRKDRWDVLRIPAEYELDNKKTSIGWRDPRKEKGELLWPERFGREEIDALKADLGPYGAASQLQQSPAPAEGGIFKKPWFQLWPHDVKLPIFEYVIQSYDTAFTESTQADESACTVWGLFQHPKNKKWCVMLADAWAARMEYPDLRKKVREDLRAVYGEGEETKKVDLVLVEEKGSGITLLQDLRMLNVPAYGYNPTRADKIVRAHAVAPFFFAGLVYLLESGKNKGQPVSWTEKFLHEMLTFPNGDQDNLVDSTTQVFIFLRNKEMISASVGKFEEDDEEIPTLEPAGNPYAM